MAGRRKVSPRLITAVAICFFFAGNVLILRRSPQSPASSSSSSSLTAESLGASVGSAAEQQHVQLAESAIRQLRSELATTNALLGRPTAVWEGSAGASLTGRVDRVQDELRDQNAALSRRLDTLRRDLEGFDARVHDLSIPAPAAAPLPPPASPPPPPQLPQRQNLMAPQVQAAVVAPPSPPAPPLAPRQSLLRGGGGARAGTSGAAVGYKAGGYTPLGQDTALLMICFQRADYLRRSLAAVKKHHPGGGTVPIAISQDGGHGGVRDVIVAFQAAMARDSPGVAVAHLRHEQSRGGGETGYHKLAAHYGWALRQVFRELREHVQPAGLLPSDYYAQRVIILEEDLEVAPDFFPYFAATAPFLDDPAERLLAVSAWNDNGQGDHVADAEALYRSSFFPGLGWMLHRRLWLELEPKWPKAYWDDWLREPPQQGGREVIRPEVCRTYHFATQGVSNNQYSHFLEDIKLNDRAVAWSSQDLSYLAKKTYDAALADELKAAPVVSIAEARRGEGGGGDQRQPVRVEYSSVRAFEPVARQLGIMDNVKANVPRVAYHGVVTVRLGRNKRKVHVTLPLSKLPW